LKIKHIRVLHPIDTFVKQCPEFGPALLILYKILTMPVAKQRSEAWTWCNREKSTESVEIRIS
jgi:hypothetical protein